MRDDELRIRLEGGAELLEATRLRYRALVPALGGLRWKDKLRRNVEVLREVARVQGEVDAALATVRRRATLEAWPAGELLECFEEVARLREALARKLAERLGEATGLAEGLLELEARVLFAPRLVLPGDRQAVATEVLPLTEPFVQRVRAFGARLQTLFARPMEDGAGPIPASDEELTALVRDWSAGAQALDQVRQRLDEVDLTGGVWRSLVRRSKRAPAATLEATGPAQVVHALFWREFAVSRMKRVLDARFEPAQVADHERLTVFVWLARRQRGPEKLGFMPRPRAALLELALLLRGSAGAVPGHDAFAVLRALADEADGARQDPDWNRVRESLKLVLRVSSAPAAFLPPVQRANAPRATPAKLDADAGLGALVGALAAQLDRPGR